MTTEEQLREMILKQYHSMREFSARIDVPNSTVESILKRGVQNSSVSNVIKLCKGLNISVEALAEGQIVPNRRRSSSTDVKFARLSQGKRQPVRVAPPVEKEINSILSDAIKRLRDTRLTLNGQYVKQEDVDSIVDTINFGVDMVSKRQKETD